MSGFVRFGFGSQGGGPAVITGAIIANFIKVNQEVQYIGNRTFFLMTATGPIIPETLKVCVNSGNQTPVLDFVVLDGFNFQMVDIGIDWSSAEYSLVADFIQQ